MEKPHASDISWVMLFNGYHESNYELQDKLFWLYNVDLNTDIPNREFPESPRQNMSQTEVKCNQINDKSESIDIFKREIEEVDKTHRKAKRKVKLSIFKRNKFLCQHPGCLKNFRDNHQLKIHERKHTGEKPHICDYLGCGRGFSQKNNLIVHRKGHEGKKPYECKECGKKFAQRIHLNEHGKKHNGKRPFYCKICDQKFKQKIHLKKHLTTRKHLRANRTFEGSLEITVNDI
ncbi:7004_t:CDS:2 [Funneliformis mosseae]|uniref:7004_t:CDS:1 n=1 Tax=Funneliformis mosseae TaxID=27381 RepID=A0A9N9EB32_FUNMO|nr:7004_t:CDS:2 [Funneliformis mosseae]